VSAVLKLSSPATREFYEILILFEDDHLLALDKPSGLLTSPDRYDPLRPNLMKLLHAGISEGKPWAKERGLTYLMNAHRLDFETSGVILLAKSKPVLVQLANLFGAEKPVKRYVALVRGAPAEDRFETDAKLAPHPVQVGLVRVDPKHGKKSRTIFSVLEKFSGHTLLALRAIDRTHASNPRSPAPSRPADRRRFPLWRQTAAAFPAETELPAQARQNGTPIDITRGAAR
jgi:Pseudouridylate synthases, 23S RNA-specific